MKNLSQTLIKVKVLDRYPNYTLPFFPPPPGKKEKGEPFNKGQLASIEVDTDI